MSARNIVSTSRSICVTRSIVPFFSMWRWSMPASCIAPALMTAWTAVARKIDGTWSATGRQFLHHAHLHAASGRALQLDVVQEVAHEEDAAPARLEHVFGRERIGDRLGLEALAAIGDADDELGRAVDGSEAELDGHRLRGVFLVAVLDRVDDRLA